MSGDAFIIPNDTHDEPTATTCSTSWFVSQGDSRTRLLKGGKSHQPLAESSSFADVHYDVGPGRLHQSLGQSMPAGAFLARHHSSGDTDPHNIFNLPLKHSLGLYSEEAPRVVGLRTRLMRRNQMLPMFRVRAHIF